MSLPPPDPTPLKGRGLCLVHAPADGEALRPLIGLVRAAGPALRVREAGPGSPRGWLAGLADPIDGAPVERVVLFWSAGLARAPRVERARGETGAVTGDRLVVLPLDPTPIPPMLAGCTSPVLDRCLRALAEGAADSIPGAISSRLATLDRVRRLGALAAGISLLAIAGVLALWRVPTPSADPTDRAVMRVIFAILIPCVAGLFAIMWARLDRRGLAHRTGSYLIDRALEAR